MPAAKVFLIPSLLSEDGMAAIPFYITEAVKSCQVFFVENERTARRYLKKLWKAYLPDQEIIIENYEWYLVPDANSVSDSFKKKIKENKTIGIISEAGCPGVADPGQHLVAIAHEMKVAVIPLAGPNAILLALMASGFNGQHFQFNGYLPINAHERAKAIKDLEAESAGKNYTQIFIETPYRNNQLIDAILKNCNPKTKFCMAVDITGKDEWIRTKTIYEWQKDKPDIHKRPAIFLLYSA
jgi:16S rRNA (cytidine1402-2'-O)-methyltransferase